MIAFLAIKGFLMLVVYFDQASCKKSPDLKKG
jgi:hypothetical protein